MREFTGKMIGIPEDVAVWWVEELMIQYAEKMKKASGNENV